MITFRKYGVRKWYLRRNNYKFRRCSETKELIWPWQQMYGGLSAYTIPQEIFWLKPDAYLVLKLKGDA